MRKITSVMSALLSSESWQHVVCTGNQRLDEGGKADVYKRQDLVWIVIFLIYDIPRTSVFLEKKEKVYLHHIRDLFLKGFYIFIVNFLSVYIVNAPKYAAGGLLSNSFQAIFGICLLYTSRCV